MSTATLAGVDISFQSLAASVNGVPCGFIDEVSAAWLRVGRPGAQGKCKGTNCLLIAVYAHTRTNSAFQ